MELRRGYRLGLAFVDAAVGCRSAHHGLGRAWPAASRAAADVPALELVLGVDLDDAAADCPRAGPESVTTF